MLILQNTQMPFGKDLTLGKFMVKEKLQWATKVLRHFVIYSATPSPLLNVGFPVSRICLFPVQH